MILNIELSTGLEFFWQWDANLKLKVPDEIPEVHFRFGNKSKAYEVKDGWVSVPNELLQKPDDIECWFYDTEHTMDFGRIEGRRRPKPDGYVYEETEFKSWAELDEKITKALEELEKTNNEVSSLDEKVDETNSTLEEVKDEVGKTLKFTEQELSEFESQTISEFLKDNSDCLLAINRHSSSEFSPTSVLGYFVSQFTNDQIVAYNMCRFMSAQMKRSNLYTYITSAENSDAAKRCLYTVEASTVTGTLDKYFNSLGIHGFLYEASPINKIAATGTTGYSSDWGRIIWQRINVTNIGNLLYSVLLLNEYIK